MFLFFHGRDLGCASTIHYALGEVPVDMQDVGLKSGFLKEQGNLQELLQ
jgi:hypothetical protein